MKYCTQCGAQLDDSSNFCTSCGARCEDKINSVSEEAKSKTSAETTSIIEDNLVSPGVVNTVTDKAAFRTPNHDIDTADQPTLVLDSSIQSPSGDTALLSSKRPLIIGVVVGILAVLIVVIAVLFFSGIGGTALQGEGSTQEQKIQTSDNENSEATENVDQNNTQDSDSSNSSSEESSTRADSVANTSESIPYLSSYITGSYPELSIPFENISASSTLESSSYGTYFASNVTDGNNDTAWVEGNPGDGAGEEITFSNPNSSELLSEMAIFNGYCKSEDLYYANARPYQITIFADGAPIGTTTLIDSYSSLQVVTFEEPIYVNTITVRIDSVYEGSRYSDCGISEIGFR